MPKRKPLPLLVTRALKNPHVLDAIRQWPWAVYSCPLFPGQQQDAQGVYLVDSPDGIVWMPYYLDAEGQASIDACNVVWADEAPIDGEWLKRALSSIVSYLEIQAEETRAEDKHRAYVLAQVAGELAVLLNLVEMRGAFSGSRHLKMPAKVDKPGARGL